MKCAFFSKKEKRILVGPGKIPSCFTDLTAHSDFLENPYSVKVFNSDQFRSTSIL